MCDKMDELEHCKRSMMLDIKKKELELEWLKSEYKKINGDID